MKTATTYLSSQLAEHLDVSAAMKELLPLVDDLIGRICEAFDGGGNLYTFGNGGSAADAQHLAAEMIGRFQRDRRPLPAIALSVDPSVVTCVANDFGFEEVFARQVEALTGPTDVVVGFTTSGHSPNVANGLREARRRGATTVLFGGEDGGISLEEADVALLVPSSKTARIQEMHTLLVHLVSEGVDMWAADQSGGRRSISTDSNA
ncbi:MAG: D-sedoheptulose-7-phosphate isomerase [Acidimicrobiia bacterium]